MVLRVVINKIGEREKKEEEKKQTVTVPFRMLS